MSYYETDGLDLARCSICKNDVWEPYDWWVHMAECRDCNAKGDDSSES